MAEVHWGPGRPCPAPDRWQWAWTVLQQLIRQDAALAWSRTPNPCRNGASRASAKIPAAAGLAGLLRIGIKTLHFPRQSRRRLTAHRNRVSYAAEKGGGRCCKAWSESRPAPAVSPAGVMARSTLGGATQRAEEGTNPPALMPPKVTPQSLPQARLEIAGPVEGLACSLQQRLAWLGQQDEADGRKGPAASGVRDAAHTNTPRHAAVKPRAGQAVWYRPSIPSEMKYTTHPARRPVTSGVARDALGISGGPPGEFRHLARRRAGLNLTLARRFAARQRATDPNG